MHFITIFFLALLQIQRLLELMCRPDEVGLLENAQFLVNIGLFYRMYYYCKVSEWDHQSNTVLVTSISVAITFDLICLFWFILALVWIIVIFKTISQLATYLFSVGYIVLFMKIVNDGEQSPPRYQPVSVKSTMRDFRRNVQNVILGRPR